jgi:CRP-like cAMP-binding protein
MAKPVAERGLDELAQLGRQLAEAQSGVAVLRSQLDARLSYWHEDGVSIAALARVTGVSRETVYKSIDRYRAQLGA